VVVSGERVGLTGEGCDSGGDVAGAGAQVQAGDRGRAMSGKGSGDGVAADASNGVAPSASGPFCMARTGDWRSLFDVSAEAKGRSGAWSRIVELNYQPEGHGWQPPQPADAVP
jgi:hypothetical protein